MRSAIGVQVRTSSSRLPCKAHLNFFGQPIFGYLITKLSEEFPLEGIHVLTSTQMSDDYLANVCREDYRVGVGRGSVSDVRSRYVQLCKQENLDYVVRLTGDNPMVIGKIVRRALEFAESNDLDYLSNKLTRHYPAGLDVEVIRTSALFESLDWDQCAYAKEHVTPPVINGVMNGNLRAGTIRCILPELNDLNFSIDTMEDYLDIVKRIRSPEWAGSQENLALSSLFSFEFAVVDPSELVVSRHAC